ncbi:NUDIX domain-containing protein [Aerococcus sp. 1KP-2016]|uniref:NUDIX domain-containing protein n=1 Tax=Aerococcus sp. 1KP-2016 TaxID=1981982 RepID=UPI000B99065C|nr:NUDIX domain-containing protein [Aerococcus sp. 1KP-2016]OYQ66667.1 DNA mismatch repair protein MutT [Aerococcus sp. 1KP-2016]
MNTEKHYTNPSAGILILTRMSDKGKQILLQHRGDTKMLPNVWDCISGHVERGESVRQTIVREAMEEIDISISEDDLTFVGITHLRLDEEISYYNFFFTSDTYQGTPKILEPSKHDDLAWFDLTDLPQMADQIAENRLEAIMQLESGIFYNDVNF